MEHSNLYRYDTYTDDSIDFLKNHNIIEYDMKSAGYNILKYFNYLPEDDLYRLSLLSGKERQVQIGLYQKNDRDLASKLNKGFEEARRMFFEANDIEDHHILSIKKDAIYTIDKKCENTIFDNIEFKEKNRYTSFYILNNKEFYYNSSNGHIDVKGISDDIVVDHKDYFLKLLTNMFKMIESKDLPAYANYIIKNARRYKNLELEYQCYKEFNSDNIFRLKKFSKYNSMGISHVDDDMIDYIDISYNYTHYILPLIQSVL